MFRRKYTILLITAIGFTACSTKPQTITVSQNSGTIQPMKGPITAPIKEEILIKNNPNLGTRVSVPKNRPTLGIKVLDSNEVTSGSELNGEIMERMPFPADEYSRLKKTGRYTISGKIYLQSSINDEKITDKKLKLYLNPVTSYSQQWYQQSYLGGYKLSPVDKRLNNYLKVDYTTDGGEFRFFGVPRGEYYLIGQISCGEKCGFSKRKSTRLVKEISVGSNVSDIELMKIVP
ncbi:carboxypeptidase regulatory-like domain-containing protein [Sulfurovum sp. bin170]|uniref:carboxypeptidase regulatory-like domain-containing protein n=1 Tax=Sulfurovum sp. bin170 TaxID=2695268 RepID=UPI0013DF5E1D|nr:carboxypeptidase regulatory-like domain-containing protein [Sulfurovum sp. bin170]NEW59743.1 carboxypeptidase regulatory-like domain-containing protein [Sulfurovum sp. bin170]